MKVFGVTSAVFCFLVSAPSDAHPGGLNSQGCHNNRKTGDYHCHGGASTGTQSSSRIRPLGNQNGYDRPSAHPNSLKMLSSDAYYPNCASARAAGVAPLRRGDAGYRPGLDRDGDGRACE